MTGLIANSDLNTCIDDALANLLNREAGRQWESGALCTLQDLADPRKYSEQRLPVPVTSPPPLAVSARTGSEYIP